MGHCRFGPFDLDKAFRADGLLAATRGVDVLGVVLRAGISTAVTRPRQSSQQR
jgi:hypothetical protein